MAKRPSLTQTVAEAAFYQAWFANTPESKQDPETYNRTCEQYLKRFEKMPALALRTVARAASAEANRSIEGASIISKALGICKRIELEEGKRLVVIFVEFSLDGKHHVSSNDANVQQLLIRKLTDIGINAGPGLTSHQRRGWDPPEPPGVSVEEVFGDRAEFANRIIKIGAMEESPRASRYVNLSFEGKKNIAQIHPQENGISLVLRSIMVDRPKTFFAEMPVAALAGYKGSNAAWLDGVGSVFEGKGPAIAFFIPDEIDELDDNGKEWQEIVKLLDYAKTLA